MIKINQTNQNERLTLQIRKFQNANPISFLFLPTLIYAILGNIDDPSTLIFLVPLFLLLGFGFSTQLEMLKRGIIPTFTNTFTVMDQNSELTSSQGKIDFENQLTSYTIYYGKTISVLAESKDYSFPIIKRIKTKEDEFKEIKSFFELAANNFGIRVKIEYFEV